MLLLLVIVVAVVATAVAVTLLACSIVFERSPTYKRAVPTKAQLTNYLCRDLTFTDGRFLDLFRRFVDLGPQSNSDEGFGDGEGDDAYEDEGMGEAGGGGRLPGDDLRNLRFKLFPAILEGPWIVRKAVGSKPTLIAQKVRCGGFGCGGSGSSTSSSSSSRVVVAVVVE